MQGTRKEAGLPRTKILLARSILHPNRRSSSCSHDLNPYRGCSHACTYCFARYSHAYLERSPTEFFGRVYAKTNAAAVLKRELEREGHKVNAVNMSGVTDPYQPVEKVLELVPAILEVLILHRIPLVITTKSVLGERDLELLKELNGSAGVEVRVSFSTVDDELASVLEPAAPPPSRRLAFMKRLSREGIRTGMLLIPVIPGLTDGGRMLRRAFEEASGVGAGFLTVRPLKLKGETRRSFLGFIRRNRPDLLPLYRKWYSSAPEPPSGYVERLESLIAPLRERHSMPHQPDAKQANKRDMKAGGQLRLFSFPPQSSE